MEQRDTLYINELGHLVIGGVDARDLVEKYGTPLYVMDEAYVRKVCKGFTCLLEKEYPNSKVCFASKAFSTKAIYQIVREMNLGADVVSACELLTALNAGMEAENIYFHGNNKSKLELEMAVDANIHMVVIDSFNEIENLNKIAASKDKKQKVMIRVNPGIEAHTHQFVQTSRVDSKFGFSISDGAAIGAIKAILTKPNLIFSGIHCHIGSQIFELKPFEMAVDKMTDFMAVIKAETGEEIAELDMGGGYGVRYTSVDKPLEPVEYVRAIVDKLKSCIAEKKLKAPRLILEPGRSIVGEAGVTLYTVGAIKDIVGVKKYLSVDGGMFDNPRFALYQSQYEAILALRASEIATEHVTIAGKCCESGDILVENAFLPRANEGDILAVLTTGAYNYSMASNYNRNLVPGVALACGGKSYYIVSPQTYEDVMSRDKGLEK